MSINPLYIASVPLEYVFVDKDSGEPLSGGKIFTYSDQNRTQPKDTFELEGNQANYTYVPMPNPIILSAAGTIVDNTGNNVVPLWYPFDTNGVAELYYVVVQSATGVPQFTLQAWPPPVSEGGGGGNSTSGIYNYVPNGQFLAHTDLPNNALVAGTNIIAQGGWSIELDPGATSTNTLTFIENPYTQDPPESPRYSINFVCTVPNGAELSKDIRIKFRDVNKFSDQGPFTFGFWMESTFTVPFIVEVVAYYGSGGSARLPFDQQASSVTTDPTFFNFSVDFGSGSGYSVGPNQDDYIAIDISFPTDISFNVTMSDAVLAKGLTERLTGFPLQTNADMLTRGVAGWMPTPNPDGSDLFSTLVLTREGMAWDSSATGSIEMIPGPIPDPSSSLATTNLIPFTGSSYISNAYSFLGIPYSRLSKYLISASPIAGLPLYGTGSNFATGYAYAGLSTNMRLTVNSPGTGSVAATDGNTGWTFLRIPTFNGVTTGSNSIGYIAYSNVANTVLAVGNFNTPLSAASAGTSGFTVTTNSYYTGLFAGKQEYSFRVLALAGSTLGIGGTGKYFDFSSSTVNYRMWFNTGTQSAPASGGDTLIQVNVDPTSTAQDVANLVRETISALQATEITITSVPAPTSILSVYWLFNTNPASSVSYYVYYTINGAGLNPLIPAAIGINVDLLASGETTSTVRTKTLAAINAYQFAVPGPGLFMRGYDPTGVWDTDVAQRWSSISGLSGANLGTFEFDQFESHGHPTDATVSGSITGYDPNASSSDNQPLTGQSGGSETRPVNMFVNFAIRY
jgi:hypothetical protein